MKFGLAYEIIYVYLISNVGFTPVKMMIIYKQTFKGYIQYICHQFDKLAAAFSLI